MGTLESRESNRQCSISSPFTIRCFGNEFSTTIYDLEIEVRWHLTIPKYSFVKLES